MSRASTPGPWDKFGLNFGHDIVEGGTFNIDIIKQDLRYLIQEVGIKHFRIGGVGFFWIDKTTSSSPYTYLVGSNPINVTRMRPMVQAALELGAESVQYVLDFGMYETHYRDAAQTIVEINYETYLAQEAAWAESVGVTRLQICNELELDSNAYSEAQERDFVKACVAIARTAGFTGACTYSAAGGPRAWTAANIGDIADIGFNAQIRWTGGSLSTWKSYLDAHIAAIGIDKTYVSEYGGWDVQPDREPLSMVTETMRQLEYLKLKYAATTIPQYFFTWKKPDDQYVARYKAGGTQRYFYHMTGQRSPITINVHDHVAYNRQPMGTFDIQKLPGKVTWLKADDGLYTDNGITPCTAYDQQIYRWHDWSGNGNHGIMATDYKRPRWHTNVLNGLPTVYFNNGDFNSMVVGTRTNFELLSPTFFVVARLNAGVSIFGKGDATNTPYNGGSNGGHRKLQLCFFNSTTVVFRSGSDTQWISRTIAGTNVFRIYMVSILYNAKSIFGVDGVETQNTTAMNFHTNNFANFLLASGFNNEAERGNIDICELIMLNWQPIEPIRRAIYAYLSNKWAIAITNNGYAEPPANRVTVPVDRIAVP